MERHQGRKGLVEDKLDVLVATVREGYHEGQSFPEGAACWAEHTTRIAEVDLGFGASVTLNPNRRLGTRWHMVIEKAVDRENAAAVAALV